MILKRFFDLTLALSSMLLLSPVIVLVAIWIKLDSRGPVFYRQTRIGLNSRPFSIYKFRSMVVGDANGGAQITAAGDPRITKVGRLLRKTKLDELPQLINVVKGEMSFVGPRPEVQKYVELYTEEQMAVLSVRPGITGVSQVEFRDEETLLSQQQDVEAYYVQTLMQEKLARDLQYVRERTFLNDIGLILRTLRILRPRQSVAATGASADTRPNPSQEAWRRK